jgi:WD40 repeat protein
MQVTALVWHPHHADYLAAGYGSFDFMYQGGGAIACFSLKNIAAPEHQLPLDSGAVIHPSRDELQLLMTLPCRRLLWLSASISRQTQPLPTTTNTTGDQCADGLCILHSGVMCLDFHRDQPHLLAAGLRDGTVCVFDLRSQVQRVLHALCTKSASAVL